MTYRPQGGPDTGVYAEFRAKVKAFVQAHNLNRRALACEFEVSQSTVDRWWLGTATPHPRIQAQVLEWIEKAPKVPELET